MKVCVLTLGCRVNQSESDTIEAVLQDNGVIMTKLHDNPDVCIVNTCTVTAESDHNSRQLIRRAARGGARVIVTGCYSQTKPSEVQALPGVEKIIHIGRKNDIIALLGHRNVVQGSLSYRRARPFLKVQDGCNFKCTYCAVPIARGRSRSLPADEVLNNAMLMESSGYREIVVTGIHLGTYGHDLPERITLAGIIRKILEKTRLCRIRLSSLEINEIDDELMELMESGRLCNHLHIPLQSGSDRILTLMKRNYTRSLYSKKLEKIAKRIANISLGTDLIIGFPGEGEEEFRETEDFVNECPFAYLHIFPYSRRPGTAAFEMPGLNPKSCVRNRMKIFKQADSRKREIYARAQVGEVAEVIIEDQLDEEVFIGTSSNYLKIRVGGKGAARGSLLPVGPIEMKNGSLAAVVISST